MPLNKFHVFVPASQGGLGAPTPDRETVIASVNPPRVFGATITQIDPSTEAYDWRTVGETTPPVTPAADSSAPETEAK